MKELIEDLRVNADAHPLDVRLSVMIDAADALESQAREIERLNAVGLANEKLTQRIKELKAQAGGVGLDLQEAVNALYHCISGPGDCHAAARRVFDAGYRLNQPAGAERAAFQRWCEAEQVSPSSETGFMMWESWQARAALPANHSEQVREWVPVSERLPDETHAYGCHTNDVLCRTRSGKVIIALLARTTTGVAWYDQQSQERDVTHWMPLPTAPSAGSQKEQGE